MLVGQFGDGVGEIKSAFLNLDEDARDELFSDYGAIHGVSAERYARKTFPNWKSGATNLSGQTLERLIELVPPYLSPDQRFTILKHVVKQHKKNAPSRTIRINIKEPGQGFIELQSTLTEMSCTDALAHLPDSVMQAATWLYDDDITASRAMLAEAERLENDLIRANAARDIQLLRSTIYSGQVQTANYTVEMPAGKIYVVAYTPSKCFVATACFGEYAPETDILRRWRDAYLVERAWGRQFIVWYYTNGERLAAVTSRSAVLKWAAKFSIGLFAKAIAKTTHRSCK